MESQHNYNSELVDVVLEGVVRDKTNPAELKKLAKQAAEGFYRSVSIEAMQGEQDQIQIEFYKGVHALEKFIELDGDKSAAKKAVLTAVPAKAKKEVTKLIDMAFKTMKESNSLDGNQLTEGEEDVRELEEKVKNAGAMVKKYKPQLAKVKQIVDSLDKLVAQMVKETESNPDSRDKEWHSIRQCVNTARWKGVEFNNELAKVVGKLMLAEGVEGSKLDEALTLIAEKKQPDDKAEKGDTTLDDVADGGNEGAKKMKKDFDPKKAEDGGDGVKKAEENSDKETAGVKKAPARRGDNDIGAPKTPEKPKAPKSSMREAWEAVQNYGKE